MYVHIYNCIYIHYDSDPSPKNNSVNHNYTKYLPKSSPDTMHLDIMSHQPEIRPFTLRKKPSPCPRWPKWRLSGLFSVCLPCWKVKWNVKHDHQPPLRHIRTSSRTFFDLFSRVNQSIFLCCMSCCQIWNAGKWSSWRYSYSDNKLLGLSSTNNFVLVCFVPIVAAFLDLKVSNLFNSQISASPPGRIHEKCSACPFANFSDRWNLHIQGRGRYLFFGGD